MLSTSSFETHRTVGKCRLCDAPQDEVGTQLNRTLKRTYWRPPRTIAVGITT